MTDETIMDAADERLTYLLANERSRMEAHAEVAEFIRQAKAFRERVKVATHLPPAGLDPVTGQEITDECWGFAAKDRRRAGKEFTGRAPWKPYGNGPGGISLAYEWAAVEWALNWPWHDFQEWRRTQPFSIDIHHMCDRSWCIHPLHLTIWPAAGAEGNRGAAKRRAS